MAKSLVYICTGWMPSRQANGLQTVSMCGAFSKLGLRITLCYIPSPYFDIHPVQYYRVKAPVTFKPLPRAVLPMRKSFTLRSWTHFHAFAHAFIWSAFVAQLVSRMGADLYFVREPILAWWLGRRRLPTVLEIHDIRGKEQVFISKAAKFSSVKLVVAVTEHLRSDLTRKFAIPRRKTVTLHDGVEVDSIRRAIDKEKARQQLGLPQDKGVIAYTGQLSIEKGVDTLVKAASMLRGCHVVIVGHVPEWLNQLLREAKTDNVQLVGFRPHYESLLFQKAADVLVLPHSGKFHHSAYYTSPLKLFEYMAAEAPIVATDVSSHREIIRHGENGWLVEPDDPSALALGIRFLLQNNAVSEALGKRAITDVQRYTWERRANEILNRLAYS